ncbi:MAG: hypothetical protein IIC24_03380 [Chloroflexi bacterium]|nr:hypothetical protein [Chloroflexota bacterium]
MVNHDKRLKQGVRDDEAAARIVDTEDQAEPMRSFLEKRPPERVSR